MAAALPADSALVEFIVSHDRDFGSPLCGGDTGWRAPRVLAFVIPGASLDTTAEPAMIDLGEVAAIRRLVDEAAATQSLDAPRDISTTAAPRALDAAALSDRVWRPIAGALGDRTQIFVSPDGDLARVSFATLPDGDRGGLLVDLHTFVHVSAGRDVLRLGKRRLRAPGPPLVLGDPDFDAWGSSVQPPGNRPLTRLPATADEARFVGSLLDVTPILGSDAIKTAVKARRCPRVLHLATHAFFTPLAAHDARGGSNPRTLVRPELENPLLRAGIALAGANTWLAGGDLPADAEDGLLYAEEVTSLDLSETELVVLSACKTALGDIDPGEGVSGLQRAFTLAGARTLVVSLWSVPDHATHQLMTMFYRGLAAGLGCASALRAAQQQLRASHPDVACWGAFICQGDPGPVTVGAPASED